MSRLARLEARRLDPMYFTASLSNEVYKTIQQSESVRYAIGAMQPIDPDYTRNTFAEGERVRNQLEKRLTSPCDFRFQGSTTNDTHIKARSDIDLLAILTRFYWLEPPQVPVSRYTGDPKADMRDFRRNAKDAIQSAFPQVDMDDSGSKAITLEGGSLARKVDVVPATWCNTCRYASTNDETFRAVEVFDVNAGRFISNQPFFHNHQIAIKDDETEGGMRKAARLMKSLKYDSGACDMSSYDITSIAWNMPNEMLAYMPPFELNIVESCRQYCIQLRNDDALRNRIVVPNGTRTVFGGEGATVTQLDQLISELEGLARDILRENARSFLKLSAARVDHPLRRTLAGVR